MNAKRDSTRPDSMTLIIRPAAGITRRLRRAVLVAIHANIAAAKLAANIDLEVSQLL